jgi:predicted AAA+ superfamily ATPase
LVRGARQVGKSTLVRQFAASHKLVLHEVNLERHPALDRVFASRNVELILRELELVCRHGRLELPGSLLFLDEIQAAPSAVASLRYLYEERPDLPVVGAGSLLELALGDASFPMPVGRVRYLYLGPMTFDEFLLARGRDDLHERLGDTEVAAPPGEETHQQLSGELRNYLRVGGMPEAVLAFSDSGSLVAVDEVHAGLLETYRDDFGKYASRKQVGRLRRLWEMVPAVVGQKLKFSRIDPDAPARDLRPALELLEGAGLVYRVRHSDATGLPLGSHARSAVFKLLFLDVGLWGAAQGAGDLTDPRVRRADEGRLAEQFVGQHLLMSQPSHRRPELYYWLREGRSGNAEVDFLTTMAGSTIVPIEVKSASAGSLRSLQQFVLDRGVELAVRLDANLPSVHTVEAQARRGSTLHPVRFQLLSLPLYLAGHLGRILAGAGATYST